MLEANFQLTMRNVCINVTYSEIYPNFASPVSGHTVLNKFPSDSNSTLVTRRVMKEIWLAGIDVF